MKPDISYSFDGIWYSVMPNTPFGEDVFRQLCEQNPTGKIWFMHFPAFRAALRKAGGTIHKRRETTAPSLASDERLLAELLA